MSAHSTPIILGRKPLWCARIENVTPLSLSHLSLLNLSSPISTVTSFPINSDNALAMHCSMSSVECFLK